MSKKKEKKLKKTPPTRYSVRLLVENPQDNNQDSCFDLIKIDYDKNTEYAEHIILPKKIDSLIKRIESLNLAAVKIIINGPEYIIRFAEENLNSFCGGDMLYDIYSVNPGNYVNFVCDDKYSNRPRAYALVIDTRGKTAYPTNNPRVKFTALFGVVNINSEMKEMDKRIEEVREEMKRCKKSKLKKYYKTEK